MMKIKITEIFNSIQGEGKYIGCPMTFVRLAGCDIGCAWCDTDYAVQQELNVQELFEKISSLYQKGFFVSITGGEPLRQASALAEMLPLLKANTMPVFLETNGIGYQEFALVKQWVDIVAMDIKLPSSTGCRAFWAEHRAMMDLAKDKDLFVKMVVTAKTSREDMQQAIDIIASVDSQIPVYLQPNTAELTVGALDRCIALQRLCLEFLKDVRVVPQVHRLLGIQ